MAECGSQCRKFVGSSHIGRSHNFRPSSLFHSLINIFLYLFSCLKVILNSPVCRLQQAADHVVVTCEKGTSYRTEFVISAMPQVLLNSVSFDPPLPPLKNQLIQRIPMGSIIKTVTFYKRAFWREKGLSGLLTSDSGPAYIAVDDTKPDGSYPAIMRLVINTERAR